MITIIAVIIIVYVVIIINVVVTTSLSSTPPPSSPPSSPLLTCHPQEVPAVANTTKGSDLKSIQCMVTHCMKEIINCVTDKTCKAGLDCLQGCAFNDQVGGRGRGKGGGAGERGGPAGGGWGRGGTDGGSGERVWEGRG